MIPKKIHLIFFNLKNAEIDEFPIFLKCIEQQKEINKDFEIKIWNEKMSEKLLSDKYPEYLDFYNNLTYGIQKVDFIRFFILHSEGGFYMDLDLFPLKNLNDLLDNDLLFHNIQHHKKSCHHIENSFMASTKEHPIWLILMKKCLENYKEVKEKDIYDTWKGRFVLQTTGPAFISRIIKKELPDYNPLHIAYTRFKFEPEEIRKNYYFKDYNTGTWSMYSQYKR